MSSFRRILLVCAVFSLTANACTAASRRPSEVARIHPTWEVHMSAGLDAAEMGRVDEAARQYRSAVAVARTEGLRAEELAYSTYRLGELILGKPEVAKGETAVVLLQEARKSFERAYGREHPVLLPVWARLAVIFEQQGDAEAAQAARATADRIAVRFFPETHFLRERFGAARPAGIVHPMEVLALIANDELVEPEQIVQSPLR